MRDRIERRQQERLEEELSLGPGVAELLEQHATGLKHIIGVMRAVQVDPSAGTPPGHYLEWLAREYPADFALRRPLERDHIEDGETGVPGTGEEGRRLKRALDKHLHRLTPMWLKLQELEENQLQAAIDAAALPDDKEMGKLTRYETAIDRGLDRANERLDKLQRRRRFGETKMLGDLIP